LRNKGKKTGREGNNALVRKLLNNEEEKTKKKKAFP